jgi:hypothetical protein
VTLDTGALIAFERADRMVVAYFKEALVTGRKLTIPTPVLTEAWRGGERGARIAALLASCAIEPLNEDLARRAGELLGQVRGSTAIDAIVVTSAGVRGDVILTSDFGDLSPLASRLLGVDVIAI